MFLSDENKEVEKLVREVQALRDIVLTLDTENRSLYAELMTYRRNQ